MEPSGISSRLSEQLTLEEGWLVVLGVIQLLLLSLWNTRFQLVAVIPNTKQLHSGWNEDRKMILAFTVP